MLEELEIGFVSSTHGLKGEVYVFPTTDDLKRFSRLDKVKLVLPRGAEREVSVEYVNYFKGKPIVKFREITDVDTAASLKGACLMIPRSEAIELEEGEYFIGDLVGCTVYLEDGTVYGTLKDVLRTGANDVYEIETDKETVYLPAIKQVVLLLDPADQRIVVRPMKVI